MVKRSKARTFQGKKGGLSTDEHHEVIVPDEALSYIVTNFLRERNKHGMPVVIGVSSHTVEAILQLLVDWAAVNGYVEGGVMSIGERSK